MENSLEPLARLVSLVGQFVARPSVQRGACAEGDDADATGSGGVE